MSDPDSTRPLRSGARGVGDRTDHASCYPRYLLGWECCPSASSGFSNSASSSG